MNKLSEESWGGVLEAAKLLFLERSIREVTIRDIAVRAGVGEASLYRHYQTKQNLILQVAVRIADEVHQTYFQLDPAVSGYRELEAFYRAYLRIFCEKRSYYAFIQEFDAYILGEIGGGKEYEDMIDRFYQDFLAAYEKGVRDGSVGTLASPRGFYYTTAHSLLYLCKSLAVKQILIQQDAYISEEEEIENLIEIILYRLREGGTHQ